MPVFNSAKTIRDSINSILEQDYFKWELLIVDDGSFDNSEIIIKSFKDDRIKFFKNEINKKGVSSARNYGIKLAKGKFITFLDSDDLWAKNKLSKQLKAIENNPNINFIFSSYYMFSGSLDLVQIVDLKNLHISKFNFFSLLFFNYIATSTVLVKHEIILKTSLFNEELDSAEDWDLWLRIAEKEKIYYLDEILSYYRQHSGSLSKNLKKLYAGEKYIREKYVNTSLPKIIRAYSYWFFYLRWAKIYLRFHCYLNFIINLILLFLNDPLFIKFINYKRREIDKIL